MATVTATTLTRAPVSERSYDYSDQASITATPAEGALWNFLVIPAGTEVRSITIQNEALASGQSAAAVFDLGYAAVDGTTGTGNKVADAFLNDYAGSSAAAAGSAKTYMLASPVKVEKDSFLQAVFAAPTGAQSGTVTIRINGKLLGPK